MLAVRRFGSGLPLVALHGFTHTGSQFASLAIPGHEIIAPDLPGHGASDAASCDAGATIAAVAGIIKGIGDETPLIGYSQGARLALSVAATTDLSPSSLILISGTAGIADRETRAARHRRDVALARQIASMTVPAFIDEWTTRGLTATTHLPDSVRLADRAVRLENTSAGLSSAVIGYGQGSLDPVWWRLGTLDMPTLILTGERDPTYSRIGAEMARQIGPHAEHLVISRARHNPLTDTPEATAAIVSGFLDRHRGA
ncbi:MAG: alpha/beta fold hydrolase [Acidimicrobiia bacterium]